MVKSLSKDLICSKRLGAGEGGGGGGAVEADWQLGLMIFPLSKTC